LLVATEAVGFGFTTTVVVAKVVEVQPLSVTLRLYTPDIATVAFGIDGLCAPDIKPFGPVHIYVAPAKLPPVRFKVAPSHIGVLLLTVGLVGSRFTTTEVVPLVLVQPLTVTVTE